MFLPALGMPVLLPDGVVALRHGNGREPDSGTAAVMRKHDKLVTTSPEHQKSVTCSVFLCLLSPLYIPLWTVLKWACLCESAEMSTIPASTTLELYVYSGRAMHLTCNEILRASFQKLRFILRCGCINRVWEDAACERCRPKPFNTEHTKRIAASRGAPSPSSSYMAPQSCAAPR